MRVITVAVIWALLVELSVGLAFFAGYHWLGGWQMGLLLAGAMLLLLALPWLGELRARYDSATGSLRARIGWWGRVTLTGKLEPLLEVRICAIPVWRGMGNRERGTEQPNRTESGSSDPFAAAAGKRHAGWKPALPETATLDDITRAVTAALAAGNDLLWDAREVYFRLDAPTENTTYDDVIARIVAYRGVGPVDVKVTRGKGKRRIRARYAIGLFRAGAIALCMVAQGRMWALRSVQRTASPADDDAPVSDEELIREMATEMKEGDDDGV